MQRSIKSTVFTSTLVLAIVCSTWPGADRVAGAGSRPAGTIPSGPAQARVNRVYLPLILLPVGLPKIAIISPVAGASIGGTLHFAVQSVNAAPVSSVAFRAGATDLGTDVNPTDGLSVFLDAKRLPAGPLQLSATARGPTGTTVETINVTVVPNPPQSGTVNSQGGVLASQIGSTITIPPGAVPDGTTITVAEKTQQQTTAESGIDWDGLGVTFLGAQEVTSGAAFAKPLGVSSAGFGNRVQPGQAVVNYRLLPDADGDGIGELVVVNTASAHQTTTLSRTLCRRSCSVLLKPRPVQALRSYSSRIAGCTVHRERLSKSKPQALIQLRASARLLFTAR